MHFGSKLDRTYASGCHLSKAQPLLVHFGCQAGLLMIGLAWHVIWPSFLSPVKNDAPATIAQETYPFVFMAISTFLDLVLNIYDAYLQKANG